MSPQTMPSDVSAVFDAYPARVRAQLLAVRALILDTASATDGVGVLTETLKWGEPAYLTEASKAGSTVRLGMQRGPRGRCAIYFNCKTTLVGTFRTLFAEELAFEGDRAILLDPDAQIPTGPLAACLAMALTYHRAKPARSAATQSGR